MQEPRVRAVDLSYVKTKYMVYVSVLAGLCCKFWLRGGNLSFFYCDGSDGLCFEVFGDERDGLRESRGANAEGSFNNACLSADVV